MLERTDSRSRSRVTNQQAVVIADDSVPTRRIVASILRDCGFSVKEAADGDEALACLHGIDHPSLAILDWNMPVRDGLETARALRQDERYADLPILMMTTERLKDRIEAALAAGADECLRKPFTREMVVEKLELLGFRIR